MTSKFIICIDKGTVLTRNAITNYLKDSGWGYWHWVDDVWLTAGVPDGIGSKQIYDKFNTIPILQNQSMMIMKIIGDTEHYGWLKPEAWDWLKKNWNRRPPGRI